MSPDAVMADACVAADGDSGPYLIFADWLEERGSPADFRLASALRWMARHRKRPGPGEDPNHPFIRAWYWYHRFASVETPGLARVQFEQPYALLPTALCWEDTTRVIPHYRLWHHWINAVRWLGGQLDTMRHLVDLTEDQP